MKQIGVDPKPTNKSQTVTVSSPMDGSVIDLQVAPGEYWNDPTAALMTIADLETVWVTANVPEKDTSLVVQGQSVDVVFTAYPDEVFKGKVLFVSDVLDPDTRRTKVRIAFANPGTRLKPNMFANVSFYAPAAERAVVPTNALVLKDDDDSGIRRGRAVGIRSARRRCRVPARRSGGVARGLKAGERVVVKGGVLLND